MLRGIYSAATGLLANQLIQDANTENLAHEGVPGYKQLGVAFASFDTLLGTTVDALTANPALSADPRALENAIQQSIALQDGDVYGTTPTTGYFNFEPGPLQYTGRPLDFALSGNAFFVLDSPAGPVFTRDGSFQLDANNQLVNSAGLTVRGEGGGGITIPTGALRIEISADGFIFADGQQIARLQLEEIANPAGLARAGPALFLGQNPQNPPAPGAIRVQQGFLEGSNVNVVTQMVDMITNQKFYEANQRALRSLSDALALNTRPTAA